MHSNLPGLPSTQEIWDGAIIYLKGDEFYWYKNNQDVSTCGSVLQENCELLYWRGWRHRSVRKSGQKLSATNICKNSLFCYSSMDSTFNLPVLIRRRSSYPLFPKHGLLSLLIFMSEVYLLTPILKVTHSRSRALTFSFFKLVDTQCWEETVGDCTAWYVVLRKHTLPKPTPATKANRGDYIWQFSPL